MCAYSSAHKHSTFQTRTEAMYHYHKTKAIEKIVLRERKKQEKENKARGMVSNMSTDHSNQMLHARPYIAL